MKGIKKMLVVKKSSIITLCLISILVVAGYLNFLNTPQVPDESVTVNKSASEDIFEGEEPETFGEAKFVDTTTAEESAISTLRFERDKKRSELAAMYKQISENKLTDKDTAVEAGKEAIRVLKNAESEMNIENILTAKGLKNPFAFITADGITVFVENETLLKTDIALIVQTVVAETGVTTDRIRINPSSQI